MMAAAGDLPSSAMASARPEPPARPFLKWGGGKTQLLPELLKRLPERYGTYHEPFLGGGALFFALRPEVAFLGDANGELVNAYHAIQRRLPELIEELESLKDHNTAEKFYAMRAMELSPQDVTGNAARTIFLNKTCFNGLYRVNKAGKFNTPYGKYKNPKICDEQNRRAVARALHAGVTVTRENFVKVVDRAAEGDLVYFDPPYVPLTQTSDFTAYTPDGFGLAQHEALRDVALILKNRGVHVVLSNSACETVEKLYADKFRIERVKARRSINSKGGKRGPIDEFIIT